MYKEICSPCQGNGYITIEVKGKDEIATEPSDTAAENDTALNARTYDTNLEYTGAITFNSYWCYFGQIEEVIKKNEVRTDWDADWDDIIDPSDPPQELNK